MSKFFVTLLFMCFCHIIDDFFLQRILADMKQKTWWEKNAPDEMYKNDYKCALIVHSFSWAFSIMLPILIMNWAAIMASNMLMFAFLCIFSVNVFLHALTDNAKANLKIISLCYDQGFHLVQILLSLMCFEMFLC